MSEIVLEICNLSKSYGNELALDGVSLQVKRGDVFGLLGRNGGGKTTLIKIITAMSFKYSGNVTFLNNDIRDKSKLLHLKERIAYLPDKEFLYDYMNAYDLLQFFKDFFPNFSKERAIEIFGKLDIKMGQRISNMSKGQVEKLALALTLAKDADLYIFDEPLSGADVISRDEIFKLIAKYCHNGATIIATHLIASVECILTHGIFLNTKVMAQGSIEELCYGFKTLEESFRYYASTDTIKPLKSYEDIVLNKDGENKEVEVTNSNEMPSSVEELEKETKNNESQETILANDDNRVKDKNAN